MKEFKCIENCADCCGPVPFPIETWEKFKHLAAKPDYVMKIEKDIFPVRNNMACVFLSNHHCLIYENRPSICRDYGQVDGLPCPFIKRNGNKRSPAQAKRIQRQIGRKLEEFKKEVGNHG